MKKVLILQNIIPHYRKPFYNRLAEIYDITVLHSGASTVTVDDLYAEVIVPRFAFGPFTIQRNVLEFAVTGGFDVIIIMFDLRWLLGLLIVFLTKHSKVMLWGHRYSSSKLINRIRNIFMRSADGIILYSDVDVERMMSAGIPQKKIFIAENTILVANHSDLSNGYKDSFLFVGRAQKRKKIDILLRAFAKIIQDVPSDIKINIVGDGEENFFLKRLAIDLGIYDRLFFYGELVNPEELKSIFGRSLAYVSPGPVGLGVLHSFAYGVPVITARDEYHGPEFGNLKHGWNSLVFKTFDELCDMLRQLCHLRSWASFLGKNAYRHYAESRSLENMLNGFTTAIEKGD